MRGTHRQESNVVADMQRVLQSADCLIDAKTVEDSIDRLAAEITDQYAGLNPILLCVMNGGLWLCGRLMDKLAFPLELDYLHATRYRGETTGGELVWKAEPQCSLEGRHVIVIDDILDEGLTLRGIQQAIAAQQVASSRTVVLLEKRHDRRDSGVTADMVGLPVEDRYVFGCGMDYHGYWRQLPAVYAVQGM